MRAVAESALGLVYVDLDDEEVELAGEGRLQPAFVEVELPRVIAADRLGSRIVAIVDRRPPLVLSDDAGSTWRELGGGLPSGRAVAICPEHPDRILFATASRLYLSDDGGRFWRSLAPELLDVVAVAWEPSL